MTTPAEVRSSLEYNLAILIFDKLELSRTVIMNIVMSHFRKCLKHEQKQLKAVKIP